MLLVFRDCALLLIGLSLACSRDAQPLNPPMPSAQIAPSASSSSAAADAAMSTASPALKGTLTALADAPKPSFGVAVDSTSVYWAVYEGGDVLRAPRAGGTTERLAGSQDFVNAIAADADDNVYWSIGHGTSPGGTIRRLAKGARTPVDFASGQADAKSVAVDATHVYWIVGGGYDGKGGVTSPGIHRKSRSGGTVEDVATPLDGPTRLVLDGDDVVVIVEGSPPFSGNGAVVKVSKRSGAVTILAPKQTNPRGLAVDATHVYWSIVGPLVTPPPPVCPKGTPCPIPSAVPIANQGEMRRVAKAGGTIEVLAKDLSDAGIVAASAGVVFYTANHHTHMMPAAGGAPTRIALGGSSEMAFRDGVGYAQLGGKIVLVR